ncbi:unnamed protein product, partial [Rangifer tarandus platyrhynchus]
SVFDVIQRECVAQLIPWFDDTYTVNVASDRVGEMADVTIVLSCSLCDHTDSDMDGVLSDILFLPYQHIVCDVKFIGYEFTNPVANVTSYTMDVMSSYIAQGNSYIQL